MRVQHRISNDNELQDLEKEIALAQVHPHIVELLGYCKQPIALVYEFMGGGDLKQLLERTDEELGNLSLLQRLQIVSQVATALGYLHSKDIVHKDIKPANILLKW